VADTSEGISDGSSAQNNTILVESADGTVYVNSGFNLYALNAETGKREWVFTRADSTFPLATVSDGTVYVGSGDPLYALNASDGIKKWKLNLSESDIQYSAPTVSNGTVYIGSDNGNLYAIDTSSSSSKSDP